MTKFYKGTIVDVNKLDSLKYNIDIVEENANDAIKSLQYYLDELSCKIVGEDRKKEIDEIMVDMFRPKPTNVKGQDIIYRKVFDENGRVYGRELITNTIFPINNSYSSFDITYTKNGKSEIYYDELEDEVFAIMDPDAKGVCLMVDVFKPETFLPLTLADKISGMGVNNRREIIIGERVYNLVGYRSFNYQVELAPKMTFSDNQIINYAITNESKANSLEVRNYFETYTTGFGKRKRENELRYIMRKLCIRNHFGDYSLIPEKEEIDNSGYVKKIK